MLLGTSSSSSSSCPFLPLTPHPPRRQRPHAESRDLSLSPAWRQTLNKLIDQNSSRFFPGSTTATTSTATTRNNNFQPSNSNPSLPPSLPPQKYTNQSDGKYSYFFPISFPISCVHVFFFFKDDNWIALQRRIDSSSVATAAIDFLAVGNAAGGRHTRHSRHQLAKSIQSNAQE